MSKEYIADDAKAIAQRMKELKAESAPHSEYEERLWVQDMIEGKTGRFQFHWKKKS